MRRPIVAFTIYSLFISSAYGQTETVKLLELNSAGFKKLDVLYRITQTEELLGVDSGQLLPSSNLTSNFRWVYDKENELAIWLKVVDSAEGKHISATRVDGRDTQMIFWPGRLELGRGESFFANLGRTRMICFDFIGIESFPMPSVMNAFGKEKHNVYASSKEVWNQELSWWSQAKAELNDGRHTTYLRPPNQQGLIAELAIDNKSLLPDRRSVFRYDENNKGEKKRLFNETFEWVEVNHIFVPSTISHETIHTLIDRDGRKTQSLKVQDIEFNWIKVNADIDPMVLDNRFFSDPNEILKLTEFAEH